MDFTMAFVNFDWINLFDAGKYIFAQIVKA